MTLNEALDDLQFCIKLDNLDLDYCYKQLDNVEERYKLYQFLEEESINPFSNMTEIFERMFWFCDNLTNIVIPNNITSIGKRAFARCTGLTSVTIPNSVTRIGDEAFDNCKGLTSVTIGNNVTSMGTWAFACCSGLTSITIPNSVTIIDKWAFEDCSGLTNVTIPDSITSIGIEAFHNCNHLLINFNGTKTKWKALTVGKRIFNGTTYECECTDGTLRKSR